MNSEQYLNQFRGKSLVDRLNNMAEAVAVINAVDKQLASKFANLNIRQRNGYDISCMSIQRIEELLKKNSLHSTICDQMFRVDPELLRQWREIEEILPTEVNWLLLNVRSEM
jgi:hypothetical protein